MCLRDVATYLALARRSAVADLRVPSSCISEIPRPWPSVVCLCEHGFLTIKRQLKQCRFKNKSSKFSHYNQSLDNYAECFVYDNQSLNQWLFRSKQKFLQLGVLSNSRSTKSYSLTKTKKKYEWQNNNYWYTRVKLMGACLLKI